MSSHREARIGLAYGLAAYLAWGLGPLYFKTVRHVPAIQILGHRIVWSVLLLVLLLVMKGQWKDLIATARSWRAVGVLAINAVLIAMNWLVFIYAVNSGYTLHASLGYFINPLLSVLLGAVFLHERFRPTQLAGLALAAAGVAIFTLSVGRLPWISLALPVSFGIYGLLRKQLPVGPLVALTIETALLMPAAMVVIALDMPRAAEAYGAGTWLLLLASCGVTAVPLLWFANAAKRLRLSTVGFLQYVAPTCQFLLAVFVFHEPFSRTHLATFCLIWAGLIAYSIDAWRTYRENGDIHRFGMLRRSAAKTGTSAVS